MQYRRHGGIELSEVGVGCYGLSGAYGPKDPGAYRRMLQRACELGVNLFDTADAYGPAEEVLGQAIAPYRDRVYVATKVGARAGPAPGSLGRQAVRRACEQSLRRLQTDRIDLYQVHFDDPQTPIAETVAALEELVREGKVRHYGVGHLPLERVAEYLAEGHVFSVLMELSAVARQALGVLLPLCRQRGVGAIAFSVTGRGLLTGRYAGGHRFEAGDIRNLDPLFQRERCQSGLRVAGMLAEVGRRCGRTPAQVAIAWVLAQPGVVSALVGPSTVPHLEEDLGGSGWQLSAGELAEIDAFLAREDAWLAEAQRGSVRRILSEPLPAEPARALTDLVYALETAVALGLASEEAAMPLFRELYPIWKAPEPGDRPVLEDIQRRLAGLIGKE